MNLYCHVFNNKIVVYPTHLPENWKNVSNFCALPDSELKKYGWLPVRRITDGKPFSVKRSFIIQENEVIENVTGSDEPTSFSYLDRVSQQEREHLIDIQNWNTFREQRNNLLNTSDKEIVSDKWETMDSNTKQMWTLYRKALRDLPSTVTDPTLAVFPALSSFIIG